MAQGWKARVSGAMAIISCIVLLGGCTASDIGTGNNLNRLTGQPTTDQMVVSEYMLQKAGFKKWTVNDQTPKRTALMQSVPKGQITKFDADGKTYYVYNDPNHNDLYTGDEIAYQNYLHLAHGQNLCQVTKGTNNAQFWGCFQEYEQRHKAGLE